MALSATYLGRLLLATTSGSEPGWRMACVSNEILAAQYTNETVIPVYDIPSSFTPEMTLPVSRTIPVTDMNYSSLFGGNKDQTRCFAKKISDNKIYELSAATGAWNSSPLFDNSVSSLYGQIVVDESNDLLLAANYSTGFEAYELSTGAHLGTVAVSGVTGSVGLYIYGRYLFLASYPGRKLFCAKDVTKANVLSLSWIELISSVSAEIPLACGLFVNRDLLYWGGYGTPVGVWHLDGLSDHKCLVDDGGTIKYWSAGAWQSAGAAPVTEAMFTASGMETAAVAAIPASAWGSLVATAPTIEIFSDGTVPTMAETKIPQARVVFPNEDISLAGVTSIERFTLTSSEGGAGKVRVLASVDGGTTWKAWDGAAWATIDAVNLAAVEAGGMTASLFNGVSSTAWNDLRAGSGRIRFAYFLKQDAATDAAAVDKLESCTDLLGTWNEALHGSEYLVSWGNDFLRVRLHATGNWKIDYV